MPKTVVIVGAGLMGLTTAFWLRAAGADVHVVDAADGPGTGVSFANGSMLTPSQGGPWNAPGILRYALASIGDRESPFRIVPTTLLGMGRWGLDFILHSRRQAYERNARRNFRLAAYSLERYHDILTEANIQCEQRQPGTLQLYRDEAGLDHAWQISALLQNEGLEAERYGMPDLVKVEPAVDDCRFKPAGGIFFPADETADAFLFCRELARYLTAQGVAFSYRTTVEKLEAGHGKIMAAVASNRRISGDAFVIAAASKSAALLGGRLPIHPVKGYSITVQLDQEAPLRVPIVDTGRKVAINPLGDRLRIAGMADFTGFDASVDPERIAMLLRDAADVVPTIATADPGRMKSWAGLRPVTPTGFPVLGAKGPNLFVNAGHGPLGWTLAAGSGKLLADLIMRGQHDMRDDPLVAPMIIS